MSDPSLIIPDVTSCAGGAAGSAVQARVRMVARPSSVPAVRRLVDDALAACGRVDLADDVVLCATELATNATLHSRSSYFEVEPSVDDAAVRVAVVDRGATPAGSIVNPDRADPRVRGGPRRGVGDRSRPVHRVRPRQLAHDANLADIARELRLFGATHCDTGTAEASEQIAEIVRVSAVSWDAARLAVQQAVLDGRAEVDVAFASSDAADLPRKIQVLRRAVDTAEAMTASGVLMTLLAPAPLQEWRDWVESEMVGQVTTGHEPVRFADWRATRG